MSANKKKKGLYSEFLKFFGKHNLVPRSAQLSILHQVAANWEKSDYFVIDAPTGVGKQFIAQAIAEGSENAYLLTAGLVLQEQYEKIGKILCLRGKDNYLCKQTPSFKVSQAPCETKKLREKCSSLLSCEYYQKQAIALGTKNVSLNFDLWMFSRHCGMLKENRNAYRELLVCDEAHLVEEALVKFSKCEVSLPSLKKRWGITGWRFEDSELSLEKNRQVLREIKEKIETECLKLSAEKSKFIRKLRLDGDFDLAKVSEASIQKLKKISEEYRGRDVFVQKLKQFLDRNSATHWIDTYDVEKQTAILTPSKIHAQYRRMFQQAAKKHVFLSATIGDPEHFIDSLGLPRDKTFVIQEDTTFPPERSPVIFNGTIYVSTKKLPEQIQGLSEQISELLINHRHDKGIIHTKNYSLAQQLCNAPALEKFRERFIISSFIHGKETDLQKNAELLRIHRKSEKPSVLISPSMTTGISLDDEDSRFQIIAKLPYGDMSDPRIRYFLKTHPEWYVKKMMIELLQACGRSIRSEKDWAITYILDANFRHVYAQEYASLPSWFRNRVSFHKS